MRHVSKALITLTATGAALTSTRAHAQIDVSPPMPNVMLLVDTSGSMERDFNDDEGCPTGENKWSTIVEALTGSVSSQACAPLDRTTNAFSSLYSWGGNVPYDFNYYLDFHRITSNNCTPVPNPGAFGDWWEFPSNAIQYESVLDGSPCTFDQARDGLIDQYGDRVRFGLMMFDTLTPPDTGFDSGGSILGSGVDGMWSYWYKDSGDNWVTGTGPYSGKPPSCGGLDTEVGARSPVAPPWEGRMMGFGKYDLDWSDVQARNADVEEIILSSRPYGATPIAGMMSDAYELVTKDTTAEYGRGDPDYRYGPQDDPFWDFDAMIPSPTPSEAAQCRKTSLVLITDGEPNLDLRPDCEIDNGTVGDWCPPDPPNGACTPTNEDGYCPYDTPDRYAELLAQSPHYVKTYVIGIGIDWLDTDGDTIDDFDCTILTENSNDPGEVCDPATRPPETEACCALVDIAERGETDRPYFISTLPDFRTALDDVLADIAEGSTSRTRPVFAINTSDVSQGLANVGGVAPNGYQFLSSLSTPLNRDLWSGQLERKRYACDALVPEIQDVDEAEGDLYHENLMDHATDREVWAINPAAIGGPENRYPGRTIRPNLNVTDDDGIGVYDGDPATTNPVPPTSLTLQIDPDSLGLGAGLHANCTAYLGNTPALCRTSALSYLFGDLVNPVAPYSFQRSSLLGAIYHSTPAIVTPPREFLRDELYAAYADAQRVRPTMLYTATTDGLLHAFRVAPNGNYFSDGAKNSPTDGSTLAELWSFIPPAVMPGLISNFNTQAILLDGEPVVRDVVFERSLADAQGASAGTTYSNGAAYNGAWRRVLVASGGRSVAGGFYYALDITNLEEPEFLWQFASTAESDPTNDEPLFGPRVPTPGVATVAIGSGLDRREVAVAVLPGGSGEEVGGVCDRAGATGPTAATPRAKVRCWNDDITNSGRTLTIVRIDTGEVLMHFRADDGTTDDEGVDLGAAKSKIVPFDSPITGTPVAFPGQTGEVANRIYIGDEDGTLWRVDVRDEDPANWSVEIAWDAYHDLNGAVPYVTTDDEAAAKGEPIQTPPVISVDNLGNPVILFSTGDQEQATYTNEMVTRAWSITDNPNGTSFDATANWEELMEHGHRVTGPIALFDSTAYFAAFVPNEAGCIIGHAQIWAVDYIRDDGSLDPFGVYDGGTDVDNSDDNSTPFDDGTIVFGLGVTQVPSCTNTEVYDDPYTGGQYTRLSGVGAGDFQLVFSTGKGGTADPEGASVMTNKITLPPPVQTTRINSWASIVE